MELRHMKLNQWYTSENRQSFIRPISHEGDKEFPIVEVRHLYRCGNEYVEDIDSWDGEYTPFDDSVEVSDEDIQTYLPDKNYSIWN